MRAAHTYARSHAGETRTNRDVGQSAEVQHRLADVGQRDVRALEHAAPQPVLEQRPRVRRRALFRNHHHDLAALTNWMPGLCGFCVLQIAPFPMHGPDRDDGDDGRLPIADGRGVAQTQLRRVGDHVPAREHGEECAGDADV